MNRTARGELVVLAAHHSLTEGDVRLICQDRILQQFESAVFGDAM